MTHIRIEAGADGIALLTLGGALFSPALAAAFGAAVDDLTKDEAVKSVIVTSDAKDFSLGNDPQALADIFTKGATPKEAFAITQAMSAAFRKIETSGKVFVAALNGAALGGGFSLALACHGRVAAAGAKLGLPEISWGLLPLGGGAQRLIRLAGVERGLDLLLSGTILPAAKALDFRLVDQVVPAGELVTAARQWLQTHADPTRAWDKKGYALPEAMGLMNPFTAAFFSNQTAKATVRGRNNPVTIAVISTVFEGMQLDIEGALRIEAKYLARLLSGPEARNIIRTNVINKGAAAALARRPEGVPKFHVTKLGVLGAGMMGAGIAEISAAVGIEVVLLDNTEEQAAKGKAGIAALQAKAVEAGHKTQADVDALLARITPTADYAKLAGCDLVVEAVFEDAAIKADVTARAEAVLPEGAVFASNTSTLPITGLAAASKRPAQFIGLHFFSPVPRMALLEVIIGKETSQETLAKALDFAAQIRKVPIVVNDSRGFYTSRVVLSFQHEGFAMLAEGVEPARIENGARQAGYPTGPLALTDEVSVALPLKISEQARAALGDAYDTPPGEGVLRHMLETEKRAGRKSGGGFYDYPAGAKKHLWPGLKDAFPPAAAQPETAEIKERLLYIQALETARCLEENVLTSAAEADIGAVLGWGFPASAGGPLSFIDTVGIAEFVKNCDRLAQTHGKRFAPSAWLRRRAAAGQGFL